jgi:hypothetical protein
MAVDILETVWKIFSNTFTKKEFPLCRSSTFIKTLSLSSFMPLIRVHHKSNLRPLLPEHPSSHQEPLLQICAPTEKELHSSLAAHSAEHRTPFLFRETLKYEVALVGRLSSNRFAGRAPHVSEGHFFPTTLLLAWSFHFPNYQKQRAQNILLNGDSGSSSSSKRISTPFLFIAPNFI